MCQDGADDTRFLAGLCDRRLFDLAESHCRKRLKTPLSPRAEAELTAEWIRILALHAGHAPARPAQALWSAAHQKSRDFLAARANSPFAALIRLQDALAWLAEGDFGRQQFETGVITPENLDAQSVRPWAPPARGANNSIATCGWKSPSTAARRPAQENQRPTNCLASRCTPPIKPHEPIEILPCFIPVVELIIALLQQSQGAVANSGSRGCSRRPARRNCPARSGDLRASCWVNSPRRTNYSPPWTNRRSRRKSASPPARTDSHRLRSQRSGGTGSPSSRWGGFSRANRPPNSTLPGLNRTSPELKPAPAILPPKPGGSGPPTPPALCSKPTNGY